MPSLIAPPQIEILPPISGIPESGGLVDAATNIEDTVPIGCKCAAKRVSVPHLPIQHQLARATKGFYITRQSAGDLAALSKEGDIKKLAKRVGEYAHDLEYLGRSMAVVLKMPVALNPPFLPMDMEMPGKGTKGLAEDASAEGDTGQEGESETPDVKSSTMVGPALASTIPALASTIPALASTIPALASTIPSTASTMVSPWFRWKRKKRKDQSRSSVFL
ncbi:unnamed protein product [Amoebophrya sp. A25]|nr:unnamed protein product [Amoebophrya sp. A25]|eukprot:GSA25T00006769001.1